MHDRKDSTFLLRSFSDPVAYLVPLVPDRFISCFQVSLTSETLQESTVYAMLCHPSEMPLHGLRVARRE